jgi:hypothetical protein
MKSILPIALLAALAAPALAQGEEKRRRPPPPPPAEGATNERLARLEEQVAGLEEQLRAGDLSQEERARLKAELDALRAEHARMMDLMRAQEPDRFGPPPGRGPGPELDALAAELAKVQAEAARAKDEGRLDEAARLARMAEELQARLRDMESRRNPGGPGMPGPGGPGFRPMKPAPVTEADRTAAMDWLKENEPARSEAMMRLKKERPEDYERMLQQVAMEIREMKALERKEPERYEARLKQRKLEYRSTELVEKIQAAGADQDTGDLREELRGVLSQLFDLREEERALELRRLEDEMARLRDVMEKRKKLKDDIVERRLAELLGEDSLMEWDPGHRGEKGRQPEPTMPPGQPDRGR